MAAGAGPPADVPAVTELLQGSLDDAAVFVSLLEGAGHSDVIGPYCSGSVFDLAEGRMSSGDGLLQGRALSFHDDPSVQSEKSPARRSTCAFAELPEVYWTEDGFYVPVSV